jgi:hypothetical protein
MVKLTAAKRNSTWKASVRRTQIDLFYSLSTAMHRRKLLKVEDQHPPSYSFSAAMHQRKLLKVEDHHPPSYSLFALQCTEGSYSDEDQHSPFCPYQVLYPISQETTVTSWENSEEGYTFHGGL